ASTSSEAARLRRQRSGGVPGRGGHGRKRDEVENAVAVIALDDRVVPADGIEHLRPQADVADRADTVARLGDRDAVSLAGALREADLLLHGVIFLVGLHRHGLLAELREAALVDRHVLLDVAARVLVVAQPRLAGGDALAGGFEPRVERFLVGGLLGKLPPGG